MRTKDKAPRVAVETFYNASHSAGAVALGNGGHGILPRFVVHIFAAECSDRVTLVSAALVKYLETDAGQRHARAVLTHLVENPCKPKNASPISDTEMRDATAPLQNGQIN